MRAGAGSPRHAVYGAAAREPTFTENVTRGSQLATPGVALSDWLTVIIKALAGGTLVVAFALLGATLSPKRFAGLFGAAPAVAIAGLAVTLTGKGAHDAREAAIGMLAGAAGMLAYAIATLGLLHIARLRRGHPNALAALGMIGWAVPAALLGALLL